MNKIKIVHLYPKEMNIYGDNGNILVLKKRLEWRGIGVDIVNVGVGDYLPKDTHFIFGGGGQDAGQSVVAEDLSLKSQKLKELADQGVPMLMICGMYQMFGNYFKTQENKVIKGIGLLGVYTLGEKGRIIGNIAAKTDYGLLIGYENHSGRTYLNEDTKPLGKTAKCQGNNGKDCTEGAVYKNVYGSYLHGPLLAKSPEFSDYLISLALKIAGLDATLPKLDDELEMAAAKVALDRPR